jgi:hypothetical protein
VVSAIPEYPIASFENYPPLRENVTPVAQMLFDHSPTHAAARQIERWPRLVRKFAAPFDMSQRSDLIRKFNPMKSR